MTWRHVPLGAGGFVTGVTSLLARDGEVVTYVRTDVGGAYRWQQSDERWDQLLRPSRADGFALGPDDMSVAGLAAAPSDPEVVYVAVGNEFDPAGASLSTAAGRVLRSDDGGGTWQSSEQRWFVQGNGFDRVGAERIAVHPDVPDVVAFGTQRQGLWMSASGGTTWRRIPAEQIPDGLVGDVSVPQAGVSSVSFGRGGDGTVRLTVGVAGDAVYESLDNGDTWSFVVGLEPDERAAGISDVGGVRVLGTFRAEGGDARILRLDVGPGTASKLVVPPLSSPTWIVRVDPRDDTRWVASDGAVRDGRFWTTSTAGDNWTNHDISIASSSIPWLEATDQDSYMAVGDFAFDAADPSLLWFAEGTGVWTTDSFEDDIAWTFESRGLEELVVSEIFVAPGGSVFVLVADRQGFRIDSFDRYPEATLVDERFASGSDIDVAAGDPRRLAWVGAQSNVPDSPDRVARAAVSDDGGVTWTEMGDLDADMYGGEIAISATDPDLMVWRPSHPSDPSAHLADPLGLRVTSDGGASWDRIDLDDGNDNFLSYFWWFVRASLASDRVDGSFYLLSDDERFYRSADGRVWERAAHAPPCRVESDCHVFGQLLPSPDSAAHLWASTGKNGLYTTRDAGTTEWERVPGMVEARAIGLGAPTVEGGPLTLFVHGRTDEAEALGLWMSGDDGGSWTLLSRTPYDLSTAITAVTGDPDIPGRVFVGFSGSGAVVGDLEPGTVADEAGRRSTTSMEPSSPTPASAPQP